MTAPSPFPVRNAEQARALTVTRAQRDSLRNAASLLEARIRASMYPQALVRAAAGLHEIADEWDAASPGGADHDAAEQASCWHDQTTGMWFVHLPGDSTTFGPFTSAASAHSWLAERGAA